MNWPLFFVAFFEKNRSQIEQILNAGGCREGWIQGQLYLTDPTAVLTNNGPDKFDLSSSDSTMIAEIKICGGDYQPKMRHLIESDLKKLREAEAKEKYMILLVDTRHPDTKLGKWLRTDLVALDCTEVAGKNFMARIWRI